ncbi:MAG: tRNA (guanine(46)-N(7))-methyltransferase TrmB [Janthinobacterium lividum]
MSANSTPVYSNQSGIHDHLAHLLSRHANSLFLKPIAAYNQQAFDLAMLAWSHAGKAPLIIDAGCGVGLSTFNLAQQFPDHFVIGIDQSADRLARKVSWPGEPPANCLRVRADMVDFWRLLGRAGVTPARQYILYPNPWPKKTQLGRRWHGHPVFPEVVGLGGWFECRSNWKIYVEECAAALTQLTGQHVGVQAYFPALTAAPALADGKPALPSGDAAAPITPFEQKYLASGHGLWRCRIDLPARAAMATVLP